MTDSDKEKRNMSDDRKRAKAADENKMKVLFAAIPAMAITAVVFVFCAIRAAENRVVSQSTAVLSENSAHESSDSSESTTSENKSDPPTLSESALQDTTSVGIYYESPETEREESEVTRLHDEIEQSIIDAMNSAIVTDAKGNLVETQTSPNDN